MVLKVTESRSLGFDFREVDLRDRLFVRFRSGRTITLQPVHDRSAAQSWAWAYLMPRLRTDEASIKRLIDSWNDTWKYKVGIKPGLVIARRLRLDSPLRFDVQGQTVVQFRDRTKGLGSFESAGGIVSSVEAIRS